MASTLVPQFLVGTIFGSALFSSGMADPSTITSQFALQDFSMLIAFMTASSLSAVIIYVSNASGYATLPPRSCADYGWLGRYGGNVVGGAVQGIAMAVSGACPGTALVQGVLGTGMGREFMVGGVLGGLVFSLLGDRLRVSRPVQGGGKGKGRGVAEVKEVKTFQERLGISTEGMVVVYEVMMAAVIASASAFAPLRTPWQKALLGGCMVGVAQASSVLFAKKTLGVSTAYQDVAGHALALFSDKRPGWGSIVFAAGIMTGAKVVSGSIMMKAGVIDVSPAAAVIAGGLSIFGARLAGGCTSGHGISGCSTLSVSSMITVASMFGGGIAFRMLFG